MSWRQQRINSHFDADETSLFHNTSTDPDPSEMFDLGDLTPQCGRRGDALKLHLAWVYYGTSGLSSKVSNAYARADQLFGTLEQHRDFFMVSTRPLPCLQVCFYYAPDGLLGSNAENGRRTSEMARRLVNVGWMVDFAPGERGKFFRVVLNSGTQEKTVERLVQAMERVGREVMADESGVRAGTTAA